MSSSATLESAEPVTITIPGMSADDFDQMIAAAERIIQRFDTATPATHAATLTEQMSILREPCQTRVTTATEYLKCQTGAHWWMD